jgi:minor extracellular serine protease Vpr
LRRYIFTVLAISLLFSPTIFLAVADGFQRITILISDDSVIASAERLHVSPKSIQTDIEPILISKAEQTLDGIRRAGINFILISILTYTVHVAIIEAPSSQKQSLKNIIESQRIHEDSVLNINVQERPVLGALGGMLQVLSRNSTGAGVLVAVIDTGVDYTHPDLGGGLGQGYKVVGGHDYIDNDNDPIDIDGHGTRVAGIIAANGKFKGVAPDAKILAYRVVNSEGDIRTSDVSIAIDRAVKENAKVINLSLGSANNIDVLRRVVSSATKAGVIVVAAAGNSGPTGAIRSPANQFSTISVGSSYTTLESEVRIAGRIDPIRSTVMLGSDIAKESISGELVFVNYARPQDVANMNLDGKIAIAERGSNVPGQSVFFSIKEESVSSKGAIGLIVFNNIPDIFAGSLIHNNNTFNYYPRIPVVAIDRETGLQLLEQMKTEKVSASIKLQQKAEQLAETSSRGTLPVFYAKPDLIAPGTAVFSTTIKGEFSKQSGTSFSAPFVTGAITLLLEKRNLTKDQVVGILAPTSNPLRNSTTGNLFPVNHQGSGMIDISNAVTNPISIMPHQLIAQLAPSQVSFSRPIRIESFSNAPARIAISSSWNTSQIQVSLTPTTFTVEPSKIMMLNFTARMIDPNMSYSTYEGRITLTVSGASRINTLTLPVIVTINPVSLIVMKNANGYQITATNEERFKDFRVRVRSLEGDVQVDRNVTAGTFVDFSPRTKGEYSVEAETFINNNRIFGRIIINADIITPAQPQLYGQNSGIPMRFLQILFGSITFLAIISSFYLLQNSRRKKLVEN